MRTREIMLAASLSLAALTAGVTACDREGEATDQTESKATEIDKVEWLEKTAKVLRNGDGLGPRDDVAALKQMSKTEVVDLFMRDPRYGDAILGFNLYYLGRSVDQLKTPTPSGSVVYAPIVFDIPQALAAAQAVMSGGNYFDLFSGTPPFVGRVDVDFAGNPIEPGSTDAGAPPITAADRTRILTLMDGAIDKTIENRTEGCAKFGQAGLQATNALRLLRFPLSSQMRQRWLNPTPGFPNSIDCSEGSTVSTEALVGSMRIVRRALSEIWTGVEQAQFRSKITSIADLPAVSVDYEGLPPITSPLGTTFYSTLPSTSTNFHRKRAAYVLKTYFCDDLTPLELPAADTDGGSSEVHASNASCQACHYRLDPIGALFRDIGQAGRSFAGQNAIRFDDNITFAGPQYDQYVSQWRNQDGTFRAGYWVIGRNGKPEREAGWTDAHGDRVDGLWSYLRKSKVAKSCLVRRLAEYVLGPKQVYDREWLAELSTELQDGPTSAKQFNGVVRSLLLSKTFSMHDPQKGVCYDLPSNAPPNRSPCAIAHVVSQNCVGCHSSVAGPGRLDFTNWKDIGGGVFTWAHVDENGNQLSRNESQKRMLDRITTPDRTIRMPLLRAMAAEDFSTFRDWLNTNLGTTP